MTVKKMIVKVRLKDNGSFKIDDEEILSSQELKSGDKSRIIEALTHLSSENVLNLMRKNERELFLFTNEDKIDKSNVFDMYCQNGTNWQIQTGNLAGFIAYKYGDVELQIDISSRFSNKKNDYFLNYLLAKVFSLNVADCLHSDANEKLFDYLVLLFPHYLNRALSKGVYRRYERFEFNDSNLKGSVNIPRFIKQDIPFIGKVAYDKREYTGDNHLTQLVRHVIEFIKSGKYRSFLSYGETREEVRRIIELTPSYSKSRRELIIGKNSKPVRHPYYSEWTDLQRLSLAILRKKRLSYGDSDSRKIHGVLFDISWLWEEYLNTLLRSEEFKHPRNKSKEGKITLFTEGGGERYPDFYKKNLVLDAKYKRFEKYDSLSSIGRDDIHQMISYMHCLSKGDSMNGVFLYPVEKEDKKNIPKKTLKGYGGSIRAEGFVIPQNSKDFNSFIRDMETNSKDFIDRVLDRV